MTSFGCVGDTTSSFFSCDFMSSSSNFISSLFISPLLWKLFRDLNISNQALIDQIANNNIDNINLLVPKGTRATRKCVVRSDALIDVVGGANYFPNYPKDEKTGEETTKEDYDWKSITKAVKSFIDDYNSVIDAAGEVNSKEVLRNAVMMTKTTSVSERLLAKAGITVGKGNKLELDEDELKKADISTLKSLFTGHNSYASKMQYRANNMIHAASSAGAVYTSSGSYSSALSSIVSTKIDTKE